jgi:hypothetical protein
VLLDGKLEMTLGSGLWNSAEGGDACLEVNAIRRSLLANSYRQNKKPTDYLLGACSGRQSVGYRFSLLTLLFSGVIDLIYPDPRPYVPCFTKLYLALFVSTSLKLQEDESTSAR